MTCIQIVSPFSIFNIKQETDELTIVAAIHSFNFLNVARSIPNGLVVVEVAIIANLINRPSNELKF